MSFKDITLAAFPSLGAAAVFLLFLYQQGAFADYIELNLHFNRAMVAYFDRGSFWYGNLLFSFYGLALLAAILSTGRKISISGLLHGFTEQSL